MEVVNNNVKSKGRILEYLKNMKVNSSNVHYEFELDKYILSIVMITTSSITPNRKENEYLVYLLIQDKEDNKIYGNFFVKKFNMKFKADNYYKELKINANLLTEKKIIKLIKS